MGGALDWIGLVVLFLALVGVYWIMLGRFFTGWRQPGFLTKDRDGDALSSSRTVDFLSGLMTSAALFTIASSVEDAATAAVSTMGAAIGVFYALTGRGRGSIIGRVLKPAFEGLVGLVAIVPASFQYFEGSLSCRDGGTMLLAQVSGAFLLIAAVAAIVKNISFTGIGSTGFEVPLAVFAGFEMLRFFAAPFGLTSADLGVDVSLIGAIGGMLVLFVLIVNPQLLIAVGGVALFAAQLFVEVGVGLPCAPPARGGLFVVLSFAAAYAITRGGVGLFSRGKRANP